MAKLTRYTSFKKLKLSRNSLNKKGSEHSIELSEFKEFINALRNASSKKPKFKKSNLLNGQKTD